MRFSLPECRFEVYVYTVGLTPEQDSSFLEELIRSSSAYEIFRGGSVSAGPLVDLMVAEKLRVPEGFAARGGLGDKALGVWARSVEGAKPYRNAMQLILDHFPQWWTAADEPGREAIEKHLPLLAPAVADLGDAGVSDLIHAGEPALRCAAGYSMANTDAMRAVATIARAGATDRERCAAVLARLAEAFPLSLIEESRDAERFLPALGKAVTAAGDGWAEAVELAAQLVSKDASSAYGVVEALPKALSSVRGSKREYLDQFLALVTAMGNRAAGICLKRLPAAASPQPAVDRALHLCSAYGVLAGEQYLESSLK